MAQQEKHDGKIRFSNILARFQNWVLDFFTGSHENPPPMPLSPENKLGPINPEKKAPKKTEDSSALPGVPVKPDKSSAKIVDSEFWWCFPGHPPVVLPVFEILQDDAVVEELNRKLDSDEFPVIEIPENVIKTMQILNKPDFSYDEVIRLIKHSPAMIGEFIKVINSSLYSRGLVVNDLKVALPRLGRENIKALLYMYSSKMTFSRDPFFNDLAVKIVDHCYATATVASYLSLRYYGEADEAFLAGLMHDIGKLGILNALTETYELPANPDFEITEDLFDNIFPVLHERAGVFLAGSWKLHERIMTAIEHHHDFMAYDFSAEGDSAKSLSALINVSDNIARILGRGRRIDYVNIFELPAASVIGLEKNRDTVKFLDEIPRMLELHLDDKK